MIKNPESLAPGTKIVVTLKERKDGHWTCPDGAFITHLTIAHADLYEPVDIPALRTFAKSLLKEGERAIGLAILGALPPPEPPMPEPEGDVIVVDGEDQGRIWRRYPHRNGDVSWVRSYDGIVVTWERLLQRGPLRVYRAEGES